MLEQEYSLVLLAEIKRKVKHKTSSINFLRLGTRLFEFWTYSPSLNSRFIGYQFERHKD